MRQRVAGGMAERIDEKPRIKDNGEYYVKRCGFSEDDLCLPREKPSAPNKESNPRDPAITSSEAPPIGYEGDS